MTAVMNEGIHETQLRFQWGNTGRACCKEDQAVIFLFHLLLRASRVITEKAVATHSSTLAWKIPWTEEPGGLLSMGSHRVRHDWATSLSLFTFHALEKKMPTHSSVLAWRISGREEPAVYGVAQSRTWLKRLSSSSRVTNFMHLLWSLRTYM